MNGSLIYVVGNCYGTASSVVALGAALGADVYLHDLEMNFEYI